MTEQPQSGEPSPRTASAILSAAETLAEEIRERAHADAEAIRAHAGGESEAARSAIKQRVRHLSEIADEMLGRLGEMRSELDELGGLLEGPPGGAAPAPVPVPGAAPEPATAAPATSETGVDDAGARLIALNLALSDTPRDEAARQLRDQVPDPERLVDEVYASVDR